jgi:AcrR family transcriptional regulator
VGSDAGQQPTRQPAHGHAGAGAAAASRRAPRADPRRRDPGVRARGFTATSLDDIATQAGVSRAILYRHFDSKTDLYRAVLDRACTRLASTVGTSDFAPDSVDKLLGVAATDPDGFRLLFHHAAREPQFRVEMDQFHDAMVSVAQRELAARIPDPTWAAWAARLAPVVAVEAVIA